MRNKQLLEGAFRGTLHLQMDYAFEQNRLTKEMVREEANLDKAVAAISRKIPSWQLIKAKDILKDNQKKKKFLDDFMPPKLRKGPNAKEEEKKWIDEFCETPPATTMTLLTPRSGRRCLSCVFLPSWRSMATPWQRRLVLVA